MRKQIFIISFLFLFLQFSIAQTTGVPDSESIKEKVLNTESPFYYPLLLELYLNHPENISADDYHYLYYGAALQEGFSGYSATVKLREIVDVLNASEPDFEKAMEMVTAFLETNPVSIDGLFYYAYILKNLGNLEESDLIYVKIRGLLDAIYRSGDGLSEETAYWVISVRDEYTILDMGEYTSVGQSLLSSKWGPIDYLKLEKNKDNVKGLYFNISFFFGKY